MLPATLYKCLSYCDLSGFYVATIDEEVVGTISYLMEVSCVLLSTIVNCNIYHCIQTEDELEIFRLSTDKEYRKAGVASKLVAKIERVASVLKCTKIKASTSSAQESALKFYSWTEVWECLNYK